MKSRGFCIFMGIYGFVLGVIYACTLILIPIAVYCFIGAKHFMELSNMTDSQITMKKKSLLNYCIFFSIFGFPLGLLSLVVYNQSASNNIVISSVEEEQSSVEPTSDEPKEEEKSKEPINKEETLEKLIKLRDEGLITDEELERVKHELE